MKKFTLAFNSKKIEKEPLYYNILIDFSLSVTNESVDFQQTFTNAQSQFILEQIDPNLTGYNRKWRASMIDEKGYTHSVIIEGNENNQYYRCYYGYGVPEISIYTSTPSPPTPPLAPGMHTQVWEAYIRCENPWEATKEQIENQMHILFPKMTPIPVYE